MDMVIKGRHMEVRPDIRDYAEEKVGKVSRILNGMVMSIEVELYHERNPKIANSMVAEVTMFTKGPTIRAREGASDMKAAIDLVAEKLERQAAKLKGRLDDKHSSKHAPPKEVATLPEEEEAEEPAPSIVKTKMINVKPMGAEEAVLQMELLGHDFFVFESAETAQINILYRRRDGDYGLMVPRGA